MEMQLKLTFFFITIFHSSVLLAQNDVMGGTLEKIYNQEKLICGISAGIAGFSERDERGQFVGFDVDFCRAVASALFADDSKVEYVPLGSSERFDALSSGQVDVLFRNTTWTLSRDIERLMDFAVINFYDGQGFMVRENSGIEAPEHFQGKTICVQIETTTDKNLTDFAVNQNIGFERKYADKLSTLVSIYLEGGCDVLTTDTSALAGVRSEFESPHDHRILEQQISKEPLALAVRQGDDELRDLIAWTAFAMIGAEEMGINQANVDEIFKSSRNREHRRLLGVIETEEEADEAIGDKLTLDQNWAYNVIRQVGNYADVFNHNLGPDTAIGLERGLNALYTEGGLLYAPPIR